jgi:hypothetical protein
MALIAILMEKSRQFRFTMIAVGYLPSGKLL